MDGSRSFADPFLLHEVAIGDTDEALFQYSEGNREMEGFRGLKREDGQLPARVSPEVSHEAAHKNPRRGVESVWGRHRARGDDSSGVSEVCETCSTGPTSHRAGLSVRAVHCTSAEAVGRTSNSVGETVWSVSNACTASESKFPSWQHQFTRHQGEPTWRPSYKW